MPRVPTGRRRRSVSPAPDVAPAPAPGEREAVDGVEPAMAHEVVESLLEQFGGDGGLVVAVERKKTSRSPGGYLSSHDVSDNLLDEIKAQYGGGEYRGRVYRGGRYQASISFSIAGPPREPKTEDALAQENALGMANIASVLASVLETQKAVAEELRRAREHQPRTSGVDEVVKIAQALRDLTPPPAPVAPAAPASDPVAVMEQMLRVQTLLQDIRPREGLDTGALIRDGVQPLVGVLNKKIDLDRERMHRRAIPAAGSAALEPMHAAPADPLAQLAAQIPMMARGYLANCAAGDKDPDLYADLVLDALPGDVVDALPELLAAEDAAARLCTAVPQWAPYGAWFRELVAAMLAHLEADGADETEGETRTGPQLEATA